MSPASEGQTPTYPTTRPGKAYGRLQKSVSGSLWHAHSRYPSFSKLKVFSCGAFSPAWQGHSRRSLPVGRSEDHPRQTEIHVPLEMWRTTGSRRREIMRPSSLSSTNMRGWIAFLLKAVTTTPPKTSVPLLEIHQVNSEKPIAFEDSASSHLFCIFIRTCRASREYKRFTMESIHTCFRRSGAVPFYALLGLLTHTMAFNRQVSIY